MNQLEKQLEKQRQKQREKQRDKLLQALGRIQCHAEHVSSGSLAANTDAGALNRSKYRELIRDLGLLTKAAVEASNHALTIEILMGREMAAKQGEQSKKNGSGHNGARLVGW